MTRPTGRFGAILWDVAADLEEAITLVQLHHDANEAIRMLCSTCEAGQRWAVVDLGSKAVVAEGAARVPAPAPA